MAKKELGEKALSASFWDGKGLAYPETISNSNHLGCTID
jgi:hypothetical protein